MSSWLDEPIDLDEVYGTISDKELLFWKAALMVVVTLVAILIVWFNI